MTCPECGHTIQPEDERVRHVAATRDEPGYDEPGCCRWCAPSDDDLERLRDAHYERLMAERREGWA